MSGLLIGILLARTASGIVAELGGWRLVFGLSAALMVALSLVLRRRLPEVRPPSTLSYPGVLRSVGGLVAEHPTLRVRMLYGAFGMAQFSVLWTTIAFLLASSPAPRPPRHWRRRSTRPAGGAPCRSSAPGWPQRGCSCGGWSSWCFTGVAAALRA